MKKQIENAIELIKKQKFDGCITGSCLLDYFEGQDIDIFCYNENSFTKIINFFHYNPLFLILDKLEQYKFDEYIDKGKSSLDRLNLISIKFKYNLCIDINVIYKKYQKDVFGVISNFDFDIVACGYDIQTGKTLSLRETTGKECTWNKWNPFYSNLDVWNVRRLLRQFDRVIKYTNRGYNMASVVDKYIEMTESIIEMDNIYKTERGNKYYNDTKEQFKILLKILQVWKKDQTISDKELEILRGLI